MKRLYSPNSTTDTMIACPACRSWLAAPETHEWQCGYCGYVSDSAPPDPAAELDATRRGQRPVTQDRPAPVRTEAVDGWMQRWRAYFAEMNTGSITLVQQEVLEYIEDLEEALRVAVNK